MGNHRARTTAGELLALRKSLEKEEPVLARVAWLLPNLFNEDQEMIFKLAEVKFVLHV